MWPNKQKEKDRVKSISIMVKQINKDIKFKRKVHQNGR